MPHLFHRPCTGYIYPKWEVETHQHQTDNKTLSRNYRKDLIPMYNETRNKDDTA